MLPSAQLRALLTQAFPDSELTVVDLTGSQDHYDVTIVSEAFRGVGRIAQHKLVYRALGSLVGAEIHALALKTRVPSLEG